MSSFLQRSESITWADGKGQITLRGLSLDEVSSLVSTYPSEAETLYDRFTGRASDGFTTDDTGTVAAQLLGQFPGIVAHVIAFGADAIDRINDLQQLPFAISIRALETVGRLTFSNSSGLSDDADDMPPDARVRQPRKSPSLSRWLRWNEAQVSLLLAHGHVDAPTYPLSRVWRQSSLVVDRINSQLAAEAVVLQAAIATGVAAFGKDGGRKAHAAFSKLIKDLNNVA